MRVLKRGRGAWVLYGLGILVLAAVALSLAVTRSGQSHDRGWPSDRGRWVSRDFRHHTT